MNQKEINTSKEVKEKEKEKEKSALNSLDSLMEIKISKNIPKKEEENITSTVNIINSTESKQNNESQNSDKKEKTKTKRHRRGKSISDLRDFKCPECLRTYLSASALKNHRRMKHNFGIENEKKGKEKSI